MRHIELAVSTEALAADKHKDMLQPSEERSERIPRAVGFWKLQIGSCVLDCVSIASTPDCGVAEEILTLQSYLSRMDEKSKYHATLLQLRTRSGQRWALF